MPRTIRAISNVRSALPGRAHAAPDSGPILASDAWLPELTLGVVCGALVLTIWIWAPAYLVFTVDDAFYYLEAARNLGAGFGWTFDRIEPTDGYHPLWLYLLAGYCRMLAALGIHDPATLMRLILSLQVILVATTVRWLSRLREFRVPSAPTWLAVILLPFYGAKALINGQESALQFALLALTLGIFVQGRERVRRSPSWALGLGAVAGMCALARLEAALLGLSCAAALLWQGAGPWRARWRDASAMVGAFSLVFTPYVIHHYLATGHFMPVSGAIKADSTEGIAPLWRVFPAALIVACALWLVSASRRRPLLRKLLPLLAYVTGLQFYLVAARGQLIPSIWYCAPHVLLAVLVLARYIPLERWQRLSRPQLTLAGLVLMLIVIPIWIYRLLPASHARYTTAAELGAWLDQHVSADARIASWDAGILGAHTERPVINLDGLVNSWQYKLDYLDRRKTDEYLTDRGVTHLVQYYSLALIRSKAPRWRGVDLRDWRVLEARCFDLRRITAFWRHEWQVFLVLTREGAEPTVADWARSDGCGA